jgi:hypothetical protein
VLAFLTGTGYINVRIVSFLIKLFAMRLLIRLMAPEPWDLRPEDRELFIGQSMMTTVGWSLTAFIASLFTVFGYRPRPEMQQGRRLAPMTLPIMLAPLFLIPLEPYITQGLTTLADLL